jgi:CTP:molybdopterin cytidylyltransferase MocA
MKPATPANQGRRDLAVIMARGSGSRMGCVKGLLRPAGWDVSFAGSLCRLYGQAGLPVLVVVAAADLDAYRKDLLGAGIGTGTRVVGGPAGGDTALTLLLAWRHCGRRVTHLWAHPVDLPLVRGETLGRLLDFSRDNPTRAVRPAYSARPGHPVILPGRILDQLEAEPRFQDRPMQAFLEELVNRVELGPPLLLPGTDEGTIRDFDDPGDLASLADNDGGSGTWEE